ncbi:hypothetical protein FCK90_10565 [Kocuria coralli]|uniref:Uncharacterized protein n=1 Tax=Kocuria coralli TaxID=1461025 RepID=A0A5J5KYE2_9MICC|nr:hypothetical protein [Kocuria coralli]KAA9393846.1 hypothetical protein FCK90_10565 [Kocuria coralli]
MITHTLATAASVNYPVDNSWGFWLWAGALGLLVVLAVAWWSILAFTDSNSGTAALFIVVFLLSFWIQAAIVYAHLPHRWLGWIIVIGLAVLAYPITRRIDPHRPLMTYAAIVLTLLAIPLAPVVLAMGPVLDQINSFRDFVTSLLSGA